MGLLLLPAEIRLRIYHYLLADHDRHTLAIGTEDASLCALRSPETCTRTRYRYMADRLRARVTESTYHLLGNADIHPAILRVNRLIHTEAVPILYSQHIFDFGIDIESVVPFLSDLTPPARSSIKYIRLLKRSLPYTKDFDRCEWRTACAFIASRMQLRQLDLGIQGGRPKAPQEAGEPYSKADFATATKFEAMEWAKQVASIKGLEVLNVKAYWGHCPPPTNSMAMAFFVRFSASIEAGFAEWLRESMLAA